MFCDYHVHSSFSDDSVYEMEDVIRDAIGLGVDELCFTEHVDYGIKVDHGEMPIVKRDGSTMLNVDHDSYLKTLENFKEKYKDKISLKKGLEFGVQMHTLDKYQILVSKYPLDFILLSIHQVDDIECHTPGFKEGKDQLTYNRVYFNELYDIVKNYKDYSVLAHIDLMRRFDKPDELAFEKVEDIIASILKIVIKDDKGIELNTSWHRYGLKEPTPSLGILKLYKDLGGKIITLGSDSHRPVQLTNGIKEDKELLKSLGYKEFCTFDKLVPSFHAL